MISNVDYFGMNPFSCRPAVSSCPIPGRYSQQFPSTLMQKLNRYTLGIFLTLAVTFSAGAQSSSTNIVTGIISVPGEQDVYVFNVGTNAFFYFDALTNVSTLRWSLVGPPGTFVSERPFASSDSQSIGDPIIPLPAGDYTMTI